MDGVSNDSAPRAYPVEIMPLGAGQEVGRSCIILKIRGRTIMLDCGLHPAFQGNESRPNFDEIDLATVELCLITHFHVDHAAALPSVMNRSKTSFRAPVFMTHATKAVFRLAMDDAISTSTSASVTREDIDSCFPLIQTCSYHAEYNVAGIRFTPYYAGHVLGACMFLIEVDGLRVLYTGDFSHEPDRHLAGAERPPGRIDVVISESTFGTLTHPPRAERERNLLQHILDVVDRGGRCLLPVNALGTTQELLLILEAAWEERPALQKVPIYFISGLGSKAASLYATYICAMNDGVRSTYALQQKNVFDFKHVTPLPSLAAFDAISEDVAPCVVLAVPGMLQEGRHSPSRELFDRWAGDPRNGCVIATYCVEGTLAKSLLTTQMLEHVRTDGHRVQLRMKVRGVSFAAHADSKGVCDFIKATDAPFVVLVHGERHHMEQLQSRLLDTIGRQRRLFQVFTPANCETVRIELVPRVDAVVCGTLAEQLLAIQPPPQPANAKGPRKRRPDATMRVDAVLVQRSSHAAVASADEVEHVAALSRGSVSLTITIPFMAAGTSGGSIAYTATDALPATSSGQQPPLPPPPTAAGAVSAFTTDAGGLAVGLLARTIAPPPGSVVSSSGHVVGRLAATAVGDDAVWSGSAVGAVPAVAAAAAAATAPVESLLGISLRAVYGAMVRRFGAVKEVHAVPDAAADAVHGATGAAGGPLAKVRVFLVAGVVTVTCITGTPSPAAIVQPIGTRGLGGAVAAALRNAVTSGTSVGGLPRSRVEAAAAAAAGAGAPRGAGRGGGAGILPANDAALAVGAAADAALSAAVARGAFTVSTAPAAGAAKDEEEAVGLASSDDEAVGIPDDDEQAVAKPAGGDDDDDLGIGISSSDDDAPPPASGTAPAAAPGAAVADAPGTTANAVAVTLGTVPMQGAARTVSIMRSATVSWQSGPAADALGEAVVSALLALVDAAEAQRAEKESNVLRELEKDARFRLQLMQRLLAQQFDSDAQLDLTAQTIKFNVRGSPVTVTGPWPPGTVTCADPQTTAQVRLSVLRAVLVVWPMPDVGVDATVCSGCFPTIAPPACV